MSNFVELRCILGTNGTFGKVLLVPGDETHARRAVVIYLRCCLYQLVRQVIYINRVKN